METHLVVLLVSYSFLLMDKKLQRARASSYSNSSLGPMGAPQSQVYSSDNVNSILPPPFHMPKPPLRIGAESTKLKPAHPCIRA